MVSYTAMSINNFPMPPDSPGLRAEQRNGTTQFKIPL